MHYCLFLFALFFTHTFFGKEETSLIAQQANAAEEVLFDDTRRDPDMEALRKWIREKRLITLKETGGDFSLSGDLRTDFAAINEKKDGIRQRGNDSATGKPARPYTVSFNLLLDYRTDRTWASVFLNYKNKMGIQDGTVNNIRLLRSYLGGRIVAGDTFTVDVELGRRSLGDVFDSKIQFSNTFDGTLIRFSKAFEDIGNYYTNLGIFLVNVGRDYYAYAAEMGFLNIGNTGFFLKGSYIDWKKYQPDDPLDYQFNYRVSQLQAGYTYKPSWLQKLVKIYAAGTYNDAADTIATVFSPSIEGSPTPSQQEQLDRIDMDPRARYNWAWYAGVSIGKARKQGDWAIDTNYQWVQAQAIADFDASGIGRGNAASVGTYTIQENGQVVATTVLNSVGSGNYQGWTFRTLYAFSDNITLSQRFDISGTLDQEIGPNLNFKQFKIEFIYTF